MRNQFAFGQNEFIDGTNLKNVYLGLFYGWAVIAKLQLPHPFDFAQGRLCAVFEEWGSSA